MSSQAEIPRLRSFVVQLALSLPNGLGKAMSGQLPERGAERRADGREEALTFVADYLSSLITATEIESARPAKT